MTEASIADWVPANGHTVGPAPEEAGPITLSARLLVSNTEGQGARSESEGGLTRTGCKDKSKKAIDEHAKGMYRNFLLGKSG